MSNVIALCAYVQKIVSQIKTQFLSEKLQAPCESDGVVHGSV